MDINMPEMDGIKATEYIRQVLNLDMPIFGFTANITEEEREICLKKGMTDYLLKTHDFTELYDKIKNIFKQRILSVGKHSSKNLINRSPSSTNSLFFKNGQEAPPSPEKLKKPFLNNESDFCISLKPTRRKSSKSGFISSKLKFLVTPVKTINEKKYSFEKSDDFKDDNFLLSKSPPKLILEDDENKYNIFSQETEETLKNNPKKITPLVLDHIDINNIKEITGEDEKFEKEFIEVFLHNISHDAKMLENDILSKNLKQVNFWVHKMKTPLAMLNLFNLLETVNKIKEYCNIDFEKIEIEEELENFNLNIRIINDDLKQILNKYVQQK
jgi:CheY-like chemotaxis protein